MYQVAVTGNTTEDARFTAQDAAEKAMEQMTMAAGLMGAVGKQDF